MVLGYRLRSFRVEGEYVYRGTTHDASVAGNPPVPVTYYVRTEDIGFLAFSFDMKSRF